VKACNFFRKEKGGGESALEVKKTPLKGDRFLLKSMRGKREAGSRLEKRIADPAKEEKGL